MVSFVRRKDIERKTFVTRIQEEGTNREIAVHHYFYLICNEGGCTKEILKGKRNTTVPVLFVSVVYSNFSARTTDFIQLIRNRERKLLCINRQLSVLNSIFNKGGYTNEIQKRTRNTTVPVLLISVVYSNFSERTTVLSVIEKEK